MRNKPFILMLALLAACPAVFADDADSQKTLDEMKGYRFKNVTTPEGLNFRVPEDMPIEKVNGIVAPIPYEEYLYFKIKKLEEKMTEFGSKLDKMAESLSAIQHSLESRKEK